MGYEEELKKIQNELKKDDERVFAKEGKPFDDSRGLELKENLRNYYKKLRALKEKYNIKDGGTNTDKWEYFAKNLKNALKPTFKI